MSHTIIIDNIRLDLVHHKHNIESSSVRDCDTKQETERSNEVFPNVNMSGQLSFNGTFQQLSYLLDYSTNDPTTSLEPKNITIRVFEAFSLLKMSTIFTNILRLTEIRMIKYCLTNGIKLAYSTFQSLVVSVCT